MGYIKQSFVKHRRDLMLSIAAAILAFYCFLIYTIIEQQHQIIELQKDRQKFTLSMDYIALKHGVESGEQFPVIGGKWFKCVKVDTN